MNSGMRSTLAILLMASAYFASGRLGLMLAVPPGYATAVWPASGIALAAVLVYGWRISPGIWLGSFLINVWTSLDTSSTQALLSSAIVPSIIAMGAAIQAVAGSALIRRFVGYQNILTQEIGLVKLLLLGGPIACLINASIGVGTLWWVGAMPSSTVLFNWFTWWVGDSIGVLVFAPITLVWAIRPYSVWLRRQLSVSIPLFFMFILVVLVFFNISAREQARMSSEFENASKNIAEQLQTELDQYKIALIATSGFLAGWNKEPEIFRQFSLQLLAQLPFIYAISWDARITDSQRSAFEHSMQVQGHADFRITELDEQGKIIAAHKRPYYVPITNILYNGPANNVIGFDVASTPSRKAAFEFAERTGNIAATARIGIVGDPKRSAGFLLAHPVYEPDSTNEARGYAVIVVQIGSLIDGILSKARQHQIDLRLTDLSASEDARLLYTSADPQKIEPGSLQHKIVIQIAQRNWELEFILPASYLVAHRSWQAWIVLAAGLVLTALLGILLLVIVGRTAKVEQVVAERTAALQDSEQRYRNLLESAPDAMIIVRQDGSMDLINSQAEKMFGYARNELIGQPIEMLIPPRLRGSHIGHRNGFFKQPRSRPMGVGLELYGQRKDGSEFPIEISLSPLKSGARHTVTATIRDVTDRKQAESQVRHLAHHDVLTHLPNRVLMHERLKTAIERADKIGGRLAVMMLDLDHFKRVNDTLGHHVGDELLVALVERLKNSVRQTDFIARMGGDEFVILLSDITNYDIIEKIAGALQEQIAKPVIVGGRELVVTSSIGITIYPQDGKDISTLLKNADTAMYQAKEKGRDNFQWFKPGMLLAAEEQLETENALRRALANQEFKLHYQPLVCINTGTLRGVEALIRWQHPTRGAIAPDSFISLAEESGLIIPIGEWALRTACKEVQLLQRRLGIPCFVAVNLSPRQLRQTNILEIVGKALADSGLPATNLTLEITEAVIVDNPIETAEILKKIRALGVSVALDDFGTGYSSLSYITRYPIDIIKIDRSFVRDLGDDPSDTAIVNAIIAMAHSLGLKVTAEGVETPEQLAHLKAHGCDHAQGYYFGVPAPIDSVQLISHPA